MNANKPIQSVFDETDEKMADWNDANAVCDRHGAPKGLSLTGKITWLLTKSDVSAAQKVRKAKRLG